MALSTNSVFHFTNNIDALKGILSNQFRIKYCLEKIETKQKIVEYAVPMVSFCDIPLSQVINQIKKYGGYGIGLSKPWAKSRGLNPVLYLEKKSTILNETLIKAKFADTNSDVVQEFLRYTKNYEGELIREDKINKNYRFYDEREWRYCPTIKKLGAEQPIIHNVEYYKQRKIEINERLSSLILTFNLKDITYIIVNEESEIINIISHLESFLVSESQKYYIKILTSKIITSSQIRSDF